MTSWFDADKEGLAKLVEDRPKIFIIHELLSNAWDTGCKTVDITLTKVAGQPYAELTVEDDHPEGFSDLTHAWTLFAESERKGDAETIGRYNMGEKLVLALCKEAEITTTTGRATFNDEGRQTSRHKTRGGSVFGAKIRMTQAEFDQVLKDVRRILFRPDVQVTFNGEAMKSRDPLTSFTATLQTVLGDDGGSLRRSRRKTQVDVYEPADGEEGAIYEMGIPVVATGDRYHVNVRQKVPLNMDRDNVPPAFQRELRGYTLNAVAERITEDDAAENWVTEALTSKAVKPEAVKTAVTKRFGAKAAIHDPSDQEANHTLVSRGFTVIGGRTLPKEAWQNIRQAGVLKPSGQIAPTPKPYSDDPNARSAKIIEREKWTPAMVLVADLAVDLHRELLGCDLVVSMVNESPAAAAYSKGRLDFFVKRLGKKWFETAKPEAIFDLLVHEFAHYYASSHLSEEYHQGCTRLAGKLADLAYRQPEFFEDLYRRGM